MVTPGQLLLLLAITNNPLSPHWAPGCLYLLHTGAVSPASHHGSSICPSVHQCVHWVTGGLTTDKSGIHCCPVLFPDHRTPHLSVQTQLILSAYRRKADGWCSLHYSLVCIIHIQYTAYPYKGVKCEADCWCPLHCSAVSVNITEFNWVYPCKGVKQQISTLHCSDVSVNISECKR